MSESGRVVPVGLYYTFVTIGTLYGAVEIVIAVIVMIIARCVQRSHHSGGAGAE